MIVQQEISTNFSSDRTSNSRDDQIKSPSSSILNRPNALSPALKKRFEQTMVEARAQRLTPELSELDNLNIKFVEDESNDDDGHQSNIANNSIKSKRRNFQSNRSLSTTALYRSPSHRRLRVRTLEGGLQHVDYASTERMKRNTDSMLEDAVIAHKLKRRLGSRRELGASRRTITHSGLSDFIMQSIMEGSLDAISAVKPTNEKLCKAANIAMKVCLEGFFENTQDPETQVKAKQIFLESLIREEYNEGDYISRQGDVGDKLFIIEEGIVQFLVDDQVVGVAQNGNIFGELSLVYGIPRAADVRVFAPFVLVWSLDDLSFRRIQALVANESLKASILKQSRSEKLKTFQKQHSYLTDLQEQSSTLPSNIDFRHLKKVAQIGKGTFGSVFMVSLRDRSKAKDKYYALKCMSKASIVERDNQKRVLIEKNILQELNSTFIVSLLGTHQDSSSIYFLTDLVQGGNLMSYMVNKDILTHSETVFFTANIVSALIHVHTKGIIHRDVKPENCLIDKDGYVKLCDFGMAKRLPSTIQLSNGCTEVVTLAFTMCGTPEFMAPEFVLSTGYNKGVDCWALGCVLVEMYTGRSPFEFDGDLKKTFKEVCLIGMGRKKLTTPGELKKRGLEAAEDFVQNLLTTANRRLGKDDNCELRKHEYFRSINFDQLHNKQITAPYLPKISHASDVSHFQKDSKQCSREQIKLYEGEEDWCQGF